MCTKNGAHFLREQLDSLWAQTYQNWTLWVSDDDSDDDTLRILDAYLAKWGREKLIIRKGPNKGFCANFLSLACDSGIRSDFYAFCDQDDVWLPNKLEVAVTHILGNQNFSGKAIPYLYCGRTTYTSSRLTVIGSSPLFTFPAQFRNALVQSIAGGNTMVFNAQAKLALEKTGLVDVPSHDWWLYILISGFGGRTYYDKKSYILYRQHENSIVGANKSLGAKWRRLFGLLIGRFRSWNDRNIQALSKVEFDLTLENQQVFHLFKILRNARLRDRIRLMEVCGLYRQNLSGTISLYVAMLIKKI